MLSKFLDPKNDVAFKKIFGSEKNKDILIHFLNDILEFSGHQQIQSVEFLRTIQDPDIAAKKQSIVDVLCQDAEGVKYIIEMQVYSQQLDFWQGAVTTSHRSVLSVHEDGESLQQHHPKIQVRRVYTLSSLSGK